MRAHACAHFFVASGRAATEYTAPMQPQKSTQVGVARIQSLLKAHGGSGCCGPPFEGRHQAALGKCIDPPHQNVNALASPTERQRAHTRTVGAGCRRCMGVDAQCVVCVRKVCVLQSALKRACTAMHRPCSASVQRSGSVACEQEATHCGRKLECFVCVAPLVAHQNKQFASSRRWQVRPSRHRLIYAQQYVCIWVRNQ